MLKVIAYVPYLGRNVAPKAMLVIFVSVKIVTTFNEIADSDWSNESADACSRTSAWGHELICDDSRRRCVIDVNS